MRVEDGALRRLRSGGWLHFLNGRGSRPAYVPLPPKPRPVIDCLSAWQSWHERTSYLERRGLAQSLGVDEIALDCLGAVWSADANAWAFPMRAADGTMIGIRFRNARGDKWALEGSRNGLFISAAPSVDGTLYVCEGPTDTAAALTMGLYAVGRANCSANPQMVAEFIRRNRIRRAVIVADNDKHGAGVDGADHLQTMIGVPSCVLIPPAKDLRECLRMGNDYKLVAALVAGLRWTEGMRAK